MFCLSLLFANYAQIPALFCSPHTKTDSACKIRNFFQTTSSVHFRDVCPFINFIEQIHAHDWSIQKVDPNNKLPLKSAKCLTNVRMKWP